VRRVDVALPDAGSLTPELTEDVVPFADGDLRTASLVVERVRWPDGGTLQRERALIELHAAHLDAFAQAVRMLTATHPRG
jgi:hypothetical protein